MSQLRQQRFNGQKDKKILEEELNRLWIVAEPRADRENFVRQDDLMKQRMLHEGSMMMSDPNASPTDGAAQIETIVIGGEGGAGGAGAQPVQQ